MIYLNEILNEKCDINETKWVTQNLFQQVIRNFEVTQNFMNCDT